jgi:hypothetical protein
MPEPTVGPRRRRWQLLLGALVAGATVALASFFLLPPRLPGEQGAAVLARLQSLNPGFDPEKARVFVEGGAVVGLTLPADDLVDLTPVRDLPGLRRLSCIGTREKQGKLKDLRPLKGLPLTHLTINHCDVRDIWPLQGMPLEELDLSCTSLLDLEALRGMRLRKLRLFGAGLDRRLDLTPLKEMAELRDLHAGSYQIWDLAPLRGLPLETVSLFGSGVTDLVPIAQKHLTSLDCRSTHRGTPDLFPLQRTSLRELWCAEKAARASAEVLRGIKTLERINDKAAATYWR